MTYSPQFHYSIPKDQQFEVDEERGARGNVRFRATGWRIWRQTYAGDSIRHVLAGPRINKDGSLHKGGAVGQNTHTEPPVEVWRAASEFFAKEAREVYDQLLTLAAKCDTAADAIVLANGAEEANIT